ncbi:MAG: hypothetical protein ABIQ21_24630 [Chryseolinea sp.]
METMKSFDVSKPTPQVVHTLRPDGRPGEVIPKDDYDHWSHFILTALSSEDELTLNDLVDRGYKSKLNLSKAIENKISWYILQVKRDLEARAFITSTPAVSKKHTFYLQLTRQGLSKINYQFQIKEWGNS